MRIKIFIFLFLIIILFNSNSVYSLKFSSNIYEFCFEPNLEKEILYSVSSDKEEVVNIRYYKGDFLEDFTLDTEMVLTLQPNKEHRFKGKIKLPSEMKSEMEEFRVIVSPHQEEFEEGAVGFIVEKGSLIRIFKCWDEKHAFITNLNIATHEDKINFLVSAVNRGNQDIEELIATIDVYDSEQNKIISFDPSISLPEGGSQKIIGTYPEKLPPGKYTAEATITYDGIQSDQKLTKEFEIKDPTKASTAAKKSSSVVAAPTMVAKQAQTTAETTAPTQGYNWLLYVVLPIAIIVIAAIIFFVTRKKR